MDDWILGEAGAGEAFAVSSGHDAWTVGDEPCVLIDASGVEGCVVHVGTAALERSVSSLRHARQGDVPMAAVARVLAVVTGIRKGVGRWV